MTKSARETNPAGRQESDDRRRPVQAAQPTTLPAATRRWDDSGTAFFAAAFAENGLAFDEVAQQERIITQINRLKWRPPSAVFALAPGYFLRAVERLLPISSVTVVAINGYLTVPYQSDPTAVFGFVGIEGTKDAVRQRIYILDIGRTAVLLAVDTLSDDHPAAVVDDGEQRMH